MFNTDSFSINWHVTNYATNQRAQKSFVYEGKKIEYLPPTPGKLWADNFGRRPHDNFEGENFDQTGPPNNFLPT